MDSFVVDQPAAGTPLLLATLPSLHASSSRLELQLALRSLYRDRDTLRARTHAPTVVPTSAIPVESSLACPGTQHDACKHTTAHEQLGTAAFWVRRGGGV